MEISTSSKGRRIITFLLIAFQIASYLIAAGLCLYFLFFIYEMKAGQINIPMDFPVLFSLDSTGEVAYSSQMQKTAFQMPNALGMITFENLPKGVLAMYRIFNLLEGVCILIALNLTIQILKAAKNEDFFIVENSKRLRWIAFLGIGMYFFDHFATFLSADFLKDKIMYSGLEFTGFNYFMFHDIDVVFFSIFLLVISEAFRIGAELQEDFDLNV